VGDGERVGSVVAFRIQRSVAGQARRGGRYALPIVLVCLVELLGLATLLPWTAETDRPVILGDIAAAGALALPTCLGVALLATRRAHPGAACALVGLPLVGIIASFALALGNPEHNDLGRVLPNPLLYSTHALVGGVVDELGGKPQHTAAILVAPMGQGCQPRRRSGRRLPGG
jgi:hypothetical protein